MKIKLHHFLTVAVVIVLFIGPIYLSTTYPDNDLVTALFGGLRIFVFYTAMFIALSGVERLLVKWPKYRNSFFMRDL
jgi:hypothetical protein